MTRPLIPYAGKERTAYRPHHLNRLIDPVRALELRAKGNTWQVVGEIMAEESGRTAPFKVDSIESAVRRYKRGL